MNDELQTEEDRKGMLDAVIEAEEAAEAKRSGPPPSDAPGLDDVLKRHDEVARQWDGEEPKPPEPDAPGLEQRQDEEPPVADAGGPPPVPPPEQLPDEPWANLAHRLKQTQDTSPSVDPLLEKMRAAGWAPAEKKAVDWAKLQADLQAAERGADSLKNVGAMLHAAAPGFEAPRDAGAGEVAAAKTALEAPKEQAAIEHTEQQAAHDKLKQDADAKAVAKAAAADDVASPESVAAREKLQSLYGDSGKLPANADKLTANQVEKLIGELGPIAGHQSQERIAKEKEAAEAKRKADEETAKEKAKGDAAKEKEVAAKALREADKGSLESAIRLWVKTSPYAKQHGLTPDDFSGMATRKDFEDFVNRVEPKHGKGAGGPPAPPKETHTLEDIPDPGLRALVHSLLDGYPLPSNIDRKTKTQALELVYQINPKYDPTRGSAYEKVALHQATDPSVMALDVAREHIKTAKAAIPKNADTQYINRIKQAVASGSGDPEFKPFVVASETAAHEIARINNIGDQQGKEAVLHQLDAAQSPAQLNAAFDTFEELMKGKQHGLQRQREKVAPTPFEAAPSSPVEEKEVNGKKYRKNARGKWETVDG